MGLDAINSMQQAQQAQRKQGKGPQDLAKALGITVEQLQKMSPKDVEKLAKEKHVDLKEYGRPDAPPPNMQGGQPKTNSVFR